VGAVVSFPGPIGKIGIPCRLTLRSTRRMEGGYANRFVLPLKVRVDWRGSEAMVSTSKMRFREITTNCRASVGQKESWNSGPTVSNYQDFLFVPSLPLRSWRNIINLHGTPTFSRLGIRRRFQKRPTITRSRGFAARIRPRLGPAARRGRRQERTSLDAMHTRSEGGRSPTWRVEVKRRRAECGASW